MRIFWIAGVVVLFDQTTKAAVLHLMYREQSIPLLGDWLRLTFTENPGMAFGLTIGPPGTVTILSLVATCLVVFYIYRVPSTYGPYRWSLALILGGAFGNIIDRVFYGLLLDYGELFTGRVVDFIHVSLWQGFIPEDVPLLGGSYLELFPIWNVADMSIVLGVVGVMLFHRPFHRHREEEALAQVKPSPATQRPAIVFSDLTQELSTPPSLSDQPSSRSTDGTLSREDDETSVEPELSTVRSEGP